MAKKTTTVESKKPSVILSPRVTEKAALAQNRQNVYVFNVANDATKAAIIAAVKTEHKVTPIDVRLAPVPAKPTFYRGRPGMKSKGKKAYVYLKKGDTIAA